MRISPSWLTCDEYGAGEWPLAYAMWCLGHCLAMAGFGATEYALGRAHAEFETLRKARPTVQARPQGKPAPLTPKPQPHHVARYKTGRHVLKRN